MDGWMGGWMDGWVDGWMGGWMDGWMDGWVDRWMGGWMDGWKDVALPFALGAPVTFARLSRVSFMSHLLAPPPCRAGPSPWLALWYGMVSHWFSGHFLEYSPRNSFINSKQHYLTALGLGSLLSSPT